MHASKPLLSLLSLRSINICFGARKLAARLSVGVCVVAEYKVERLEYARSNYMCHFNWYNYIWLHSCSRCCATCAPAWMLTASKQMHHIRISARSHSKHQWISSTFLHGLQLKPKMSVHSHSNLEKTLVRFAFFHPTAITITIISIRNGHGREPISIVWANGKFCGICSRQLFRLPPHGPANGNCAMLGHAKRRDGCNLQMAKSMRCAGGNRKLEMASYTLSSGQPDVCTCK